MNIWIGKFLSKYNLIDEKSRDEVLVYLNVFTNKIAHYMENRRSKSFVDSKSFDIYSQKPRGNK